VDSAAPIKNNYSIIKFTLGNMSRLIIAPVAISQSLILIALGADQQAIKAPLFIGGLSIYLVMFLYILIDILEQKAVSS